MDVAICVLNKNGAVLNNNVVGKIYDVEPQYEHKDFAIAVNRTIQKAINDGNKTIAVVDSYTIPINGLQENNVLYGQNVSLKEFLRGQFNPNETVRMEPCGIVLSAENWVKIGGFRNLSGSVTKNIKDICSKKQLSLTIYKSVPRINANFLEPKIESTKEYIALNLPNESPKDVSEPEKKVVKKTTSRRGSK